MPSPGKVVGKALHWPALLLSPLTSCPAVLGGCILMGNSMRTSPLLHQGAGMVALDGAAVHGAGVYFAPYEKMVMETDVC